MQKIIFPDLSSITNCLYSIFHETRDSLVICAISGCCACIHTIRYVTCNHNKEQYCTNGERNSKHNSLLTNLPFGFGIHSSEPVTENNNLLKRSELKRYFN